MSESIEQIERVTPLYDIQKGLGARFGSNWGWTMPESFGDPRQEHSRVRSTVGLLDLSNRGAIKVGGKEGPQFLNGLVTNDVKTLESGKGIRAAFLTGHGKVKALCTILGLGDEFLLITEPATHDKIYKAIFPFSYAGDFKVEDVSAHHRCLSIQGPGALLVMKEVCFEPIPSLDSNGWVETTIAGQRVTVVRNSHTGEEGFDLFVSESGLRDLWDFMLLKGEFHSIAPVGFLALDSLRIEAGIPVYGIDIDESNMMLETGLLEAVSYTKGCYTGQEAVAMATYRGHVSKRLSGLAVAGDVVLSPGDKVKKDGKEIGYITSALRSDSLGAIIALGYVKYGFFELGSDLEIDSGGNLNPATVVELPFYKRN